MDKTNTANVPITTTTTPTDGPKLTNLLSNENFAIGMTMTSMLMVIVSYCMVRFNLYSLLFVPATLMLFGILLLNGYRGFDKPISNVAIGTEVVAVVVTIVLFIMFSKYWAAEN